MTSTLPAPLRAPRATLAAHGRSFHHGARLLGPTHADRAARLYAWCRRVDDLADDAQTAGERARAVDRLLALRTALACEDGRDPLAGALLTLCDETTANPAPAIALVDGVLGDLDHVAVPDERALLRYSHAVAGTVGLLMLPLLDVHDVAARPFAIDLGIAMQLTNIARDVAEDANAGRRYLPASWLGAIPPSRIADPDAAARAAVTGAVQRALGLAERYYASGEAGLGFLPPRPRAAIRVAARVYRRIGRRLALQGFDVWAGRTVVPAATKAAVTVGALARDLTVPGAPPAHDRALHSPLTGCVGAEP